jgi:uncharacterized protein YjbI with pentapeptide repeats
MADAKIDPFDVGALERAVNDSAGRVSGIWLSFVAFSAYLAAAASMISHRQIFLEEPIKLPTINIDLPLVASAILLPLLFVIYHVFVLLQVVLLARTANAYNEAIEKAVPDAADRSLLRQRLANTLFAQLFAGSPREREGVLGGLLRLMAWVTLAFGPILVLLLFQSKFLPYQNDAVTWAHRALVAIDLLAILWLWGAAVTVHRDMTWRAVVQNRISTASAAIVVLVTVLLLTFPGELHTTWAKTLLYDSAYVGHDAAECRIPRIIAAVLPSGFDRLTLQGASFVDADKLAKMDKATAESGRKPSGGERTRVFRNRNFNCATLSGADLRRADFSGAHLVGGMLEGVDLRGARLTEAVLKNASLPGAKLDDADLTGASLPRAEITQATLARSRFDDAHLERASLFDSDLTNATFKSANLRGSNFDRANLRGANLESANLKGAILAGADLTGASLFGAALQAARINGARLEGADLSRATLSGARLYWSRLQGANLSHATIEGADFTGAQLQGANFHQTTMTLSAFNEAYLWRALWRESWSPDRSTCRDAYVVNPNFTSVLSIAEAQGNDPPNQTAATPDELRIFVESTRKVLGGMISKERQFTLDELLSAGPDDEAARYSEATWRACAEKVVPEDQYDQQLVAYLIRLACTPGTDQDYVSKAVYSHWIKNAFDKPTQQVLVRSLAGLNGSPCPGAAAMSAAMLEEAATK